MFFRKKKKGMPVPIEEVQRLMESGLSDKDTIKELKSQGYEYEDIEKAMLQAVKAGVGEEKPKERKQMESIIGRYGEEQPSMQNDDELPLLGEVYPTEGGTYNQEIKLPEAEEPELIIEELVEGVVEEKWQRLSDSVNKINSKIEEVRIGFEQVIQRMNEKKGGSGKDFGPDIADLSRRLEDLEIRIGGLEKAFKQLLPSLTRNIENLSTMVHEMKSKA
jgi:hypothetical protein